MKITWNKSLRIWWPEDAYWVIFSEMQTRPMTEDEWLKIKQFIKQLNLKLGNTDLPKDLME